MKLPLLSQIFHDTLLIINNVALRSPLGSASVNFEGQCYIGEGNAFQYYVIDIKSPFEYFLQS